MLVQIEFKNTIILFNLLLFMSYLFKNICENIKIEFLKNACFKYIYFNYVVINPG